MAPEPVQAVIQRRGILNYAVMATVHVEIAVLMSSGARMECTAAAGVHHQRKARPARRIKTAPAADHQKYRATTAGHAMAKMPRGNVLSETGDHFCCARSD